MSEAGMWSAESLAVVAGAFFVAGTVKGALGLGLPTTAIGLLAATLGVQRAMALMIAPSLFANVWQALAGGRLRELLGRMWPYLVAAVPLVWVGAALVPRLGNAVPSLLLAAVLWIYAGIGLRARPMRHFGRAQRWLVPMLGGLNGLLTGLTGAYVLPGVIYLNSLGLGRDALIQAMGILFTVSTGALGLALGGLDLYSRDLATLSVLAIAPTWAGVVAGRGIRRRLSEAHFRRAFFVALAAIGGWIVIKVALGARG